MAKEFQLTPQRRRILEVLRDHGEIQDKSGLAVDQLMKHTGHRTTNALSGVLQALEQAGLIAREVGGRRTYSIKITPTGKDVLLATKPQVKRKRVPADVERGCPVVIVVVVDSCPRLSP